MKKITIIITVIATLAILLTSCTDKNGFRTNKSGLKYKYYVKGSGDKAQDGDILFGKIAIFRDTVQIQGTSKDSSILFQLPTAEYLKEHPEIEKDITLEAIKMLRKGDSIRFAFDQNIIFAKNPEQIDSSFQYFYYVVYVQDIVSEADHQQHEEEKKLAARTEESAALYQYLENNQIKVNPDTNGVYVVLERAGSGKKIAKGDEVGIKYVGKFISGSIFDTNNEKVAKEEGTYSEYGHYDPLTFKVGNNMVIKGMDDAVVGLQKGTKAKLIIPSSVGYGEQQRGPIPAFSTLIFDIEIVSVK
ncbi:MAG: FKBP-type peptidyl-prolyl cis-trans isomerase [Bacteroidales bacterium]|jgi:FKBP-type peptidyl-prolyl cis-trans isomerase|nr:FKBP-type peptidyl-prolyl cis-trans isomerase [Bacteroidales bacterium]